MNSFKIMDDCLSGIITVNNFKSLFKVQNDFFEERFNTT